MSDTPEPNLEAFSEELDALAHRAQEAAKAEGDNGPTRGVCAQEAKALVVRHLNEVTIASGQLGWSRQQANEYEKKMRRRLVARQEGAHRRALPVYVAALAQLDEARGPSPRTPGFQFDPKPKR